MVQVDKGGPGGFQQAHPCLCGVRLLSKTLALLTHPSPALWSSPTTLKFSSSSRVESSLRKVPLDSFKMGEVLFVVHIYRFSV